MEKRGFLAQPAAQIVHASVQEHYNRLSGEKSPYLLQHADNPIYWYPWGEEAFAAARRENKPIFLSIGYSSCHWCHVLEEESFGDQEVADVLNQGYISIKVDREEHPDVDQMYMDIVQAMTGNGGWPMTVVMSPDMMPFFGGSYFPKDQLLQILRGLRSAWENEPEKIATIGRQVSDYLDSRNALSTGEVSLDEGVLRQIYRRLHNLSDPVHGGFGSAPKFPPAIRLELLNRIARRTGEKEALEIVSSTLENMARGGMYDHLGGGFHRYSTDQEWLVPHFEKMLYGQAALAQAYLEGFQTTQNRMFEWVARGTLDYVLREMTDPDGGFYSAEDADSEGEEGKFYVWSDRELRDILTEKEYRRVAETYGVSPEGNFELLGQPVNILHLPDPVPWKVKLEPDLAAIHAKLLRQRERRPPPPKDDKVITAWNGLMLGSMAKAYQVLGDKKYLAAAQNAARFIQTRLYRDGKLLRRYRDGDAG
ncbi:MAG: thioredoxin domain-containing protein, partial [Nitrospinales bacterium]